MRKTVLTVLATVLALGIGFVSYYAIQDVMAHRRSAHRADFYLYGPTDVKDAKGKPLTRAELLDLLLRDALKQKATP